MFKCLGVTMHCNVADMLTWCLKDDSCLPSKTQNLKKEKKFNYGEL